MRVHGQGGQGEDADAAEARGSDQEEEEEEDKLVAGCNNFQGTLKQITGRSISCKWHPTLVPFAQVLIGRFGLIQPS